MSDFVGGYPEYQLEFLGALAAGGNIVIAPEFPRTSRFNPGGPDAANTGSQPGDLSFLIDTVTDLAADPKWPLAGIVDSSRIAAAKGLLTLEGGDHGSWFGADHEFLTDVVTTILDFLSAAIDNDEDAAIRLQQLRSSSNVQLVFAAEADSDLTVEVELAETNRQASADPPTDLVDGQTVVVTWSGFLPEQSVNILQCSQGGTEGSGVCDFTNARILHPNPTGEGSVELAIIAGAVGTGICDASVDDCVVAVNDSGLQDPEATIRIPLSFAP